MMTEFEKMLNDKYGLKGKYEKYKFINLYNNWLELQNRSRWQLNTKTNLVKTIQYNQGFIKFKAYNADCKYFMYEAGTITGNDPEDIIQMALYNDEEFIEYLKDLEKEQIKELPKEITYAYYNLSYETKDLPLDQRISNQLMWDYGFYICDFDYEELDDKFISVTNIDWEV